MMQTQQEIDAELTTEIAHALSRSGPATRIADAEWMQRLVKHWLSETLGLESSVRWQQANDEA